MTTFPSRWESVRLGDIASPVNTTVATDSSRRYLGLEHVEAQSTKILSTGDGGSIKSNVKPFAPGFTLYARLRPYLNKVCTPDFEGGASSEFIVFPPVGWLAPRYLLYLLNSPSFVAYANQSAEGIERPRLSWAQMGKFPSALPPLNEQRRIVDAIEEHLSRLDAADASLEAALGRISAFEASTLHTLIDEQSATMTAISELAEFVTDGDHNPPRRVPVGVPHLTAKNVKNGKLLTDGASFVSDEGFAQTRQRYDPREGDVVVTCVGTIGETAVVPSGMTFSADRNLAAIRPADGVDPAYVRLALTTRRTRQTMQAASSSTAQPHLYLRDLRSLEIPLPLLDEQHSIVARVEERLSTTDAVRAAIEGAQRRSRSLRRAVLDRAFRGELVPQDPSDEPASVLLERVRAERAAAPAASRPRRVTA